MESDRWEVLDADECDRLLRGGTGHNKRKRIAVRQGLFRGTYARCHSREINWDLGQLRGTSCARNSRKRETVKRHAVSLLKGCAC